ncbi:MAG: hypothetical protein ACHQFX_01170 [Chitinophagales bacterium]
MNQERKQYDQKIDAVRIERIKAELSELDNELVNADGVQLKPGQCYHFETNPLHVLFNTNCPDELKQKVEEIISRHIADV